MSILFLFSKIKNMKLIKLFTEELSIEKPRKVRSPLQKTQVKMKSVSNKVNEKMKEIFHPEFLAEVYKKMPKKILLRKIESKDEIKASSAFVVIKPSYSTIEIINYSSFPLDRIKAKKIERMGKSEKTIFINTEYVTVENLVETIIHELLHLIEVRIRKKFF